MAAVVEQAQRLVKTANMAGKHALTAGLQICVARLSLLGVYGAFGAVGPPAAGPQAPVCGADANIARVAPAISTSASRHAGLTPAMLMNP